MLRKAYTIQYCIIWAVPKFPYSFSLIWLTISMIWCAISVIATGSLVAYLTSSTKYRCLFPQKVIKIDRRSQNT